MKNYTGKILTTIIVLFSYASYAQVVKTPLASSAGSVSSVIGLTDVKIEYYRPKAKGRAIFGSGDKYLVPFGKIWRTGANYGTKISFSDDVQVEGNKVSAGTYLIFTWPNASSWNIALYSDLELRGNVSKYDESKEVAKFTVNSKKLADKVETFTVSIGDISTDNTRAKVELAWDNTSVKFAVVAEYDERVMKSISKNTKVNPSNLITAARYYHENKKDFKQALIWTNQYLAVGDNSTQFWNLHFKAKLLVDMGKKNEALETAQKSLEYATKAENNFYVAQNKSLIEKLSKK